MSSTETENPPVEGETAPVVVDLSNLSDARIEDQEGFKKSLATLLDLAKGAVREAKRYTNATKSLAEARVAIRSFIIRTDGFPDWAASSDAYSVAVATAETPVLAPLGADATRRLNQAVRQHVKRNYLLPGIVGYVLTHADNKPKLEAEATRWGQGQLDREAILTGPSADLVREVRKHYTAAKLTLPEGPFGETNPGSGGNPGPGQGTPSSALQSLLGSLDGIGQIVPRYGVVGLLATATAISKKLVDGKTSEVKDRPMVIKNLKRVAAICTTTAAMLDPSASASDADEKAMEDAYYDATADKIDD